MNPSLRILLTGGSGFLGRHIYHQLSGEGHTVVRVGRDASNEINCDLAAVVPQVEGAFDLVVHAMGKAHMVPANEQEAKAFFDVNLNGTRHLCQALEQLPSLPAAFVFISSVAVYGLEEGNAIDENTALAGQTPYARSKVEAEQFLRQWCEKRNIRLTILRLPLVVGKGAPGNLGDMERAIAKGRYVQIGGGTARKSMVLAADVARYILPASAVGGIYHLTDDVHPSFAEVGMAMAGMLGKPRPRNVLLWIAQAAAIFGDLVGPPFPLDTKRLKKMTATLIFDDQKAKKAFGWRPSPALSIYKPS